MGKGGGMGEIGARGSPLTAPPFGPSNAQNLQHQTPFKTLYYYTETDHLLAAGSGFFAR